MIRAFSLFGTICYVVILCNTALSPIQMGFALIGLLAGIVMTLAY